MTAESSKNLAYEMMLFKFSYHTKIVHLKLFGLFFLVGFAACSGDQSEKESAGAAADSTNFRADTVQVAVTNVRPMNFVRSLTATGTLSAREQATVRAKVGGEVTDVYVDIGDHVQKDETLLKIDPTDYQLSLQEAEAQLAQAKATLDDSKREKKRMAGLYKAGSATEQNRDKAMTAFQQARAGYKQAMAAKNKAQQELDYTTIQAPFSGVVTKRMFKKGDYASVAQPAAEVTDLSYFEAEMNLPEQYAGSIHKGLRVEMGFQSQIDSVEGVVTAVNRQIDTDSRTFLVKVGLKNPEQILSDGLFFNAKFALPKVKDQPAVPVSAVQQDQGDNILWVIKNGKANRRVVVQGSENGNWVMIQQGAKIGETVAVGGTGSLIDGYPVRTSRVDSLSN